MGSGLGQANKNGLVNQSAKQTETSGQSGKEKEKKSRKQHKKRKKMIAGCCLIWTKECFKFNKPKTIVSFVYATDKVMNEWTCLQDKL